MSDVLGVAAFEIGDPMRLVVLMEADDAPITHWARRGRTVPAASPYTLTLEGSC